MAFRSNDVLPGSYVLTADASVGDKGYAGRVPLQVAGTDIKDLVVQLAPIFDVSGRIQIEGAPPSRRGEQGTAPAAPAAPAPGSQIGSLASQILARLNGRFPEPADPPDRRRFADRVREAQWPAERRRDDCL